MFKILFKTSTDTIIPYSPDKRLLAAWERVVGLAVVLVSGTLVEGAVFVSSAKVEVAALVSSTLVRGAVLFSRAIGVAAVLVTGNLVVGVSLEPVEAELGIGDGVVGSGPLQ